MHEPAMVTETEQASLSGAANLSACITRPKSRSHSRKGLCPRPARRSSQLARRVAPRIAGARGTRGTSGRAEPREARFRLGAVLIVVVLLMMVVSVLSHKLGMETGLSVALFPMVIIAMTIERMSIVWEETGAADALKAAAGSLLVACIAYVVMGLDWLEHVVFTFPELLLVVLAVVILMGRYTGYRLVELLRFRESNPRC